MEDLDLDLVSGTAYRIWRGVMEEGHMLVAMNDGGSAEIRTVKSAWSPQGCALKAWVAIFSTNMDGVSSVTVIILVMRSNLEQRLQTTKSATIHGCLSAYLRHHRGMSDMRARVSGNNSC